jgi:hypothetical protein
MDARRTEEVVEAVCRIPMDFRSLRNVSAMQLVRQTGYASVRSAISVELIGGCLGAHPDWIEAWLTWSTDNRSSPSWWIKCASPTSCRVGYYDPSHEHQEPPIRFDDKVRACAEYVLREVSQIAGLE